MSSSSPDPNFDRLTRQSVALDEPRTVDRLEAASTLVFRTPLQPYPLAADTKAAAILTGVGLMFTLVAQHAAALRVLEQKSLSVEIVALALLLGFVAASVATSVLAFRVIWPRFGSGPPSLAFFGSIAEMTLEEYSRRVRAVDHDACLEEMMRYNHALSRICADKFSTLRSTVRVFAAAGLCWIGLMVLIATRAVLP